MTTATARATASATPLRLFGRRVLRVLENTLFQHPQGSRHALGLLRRVRPVVRIGTIAIATSHAETREILERDEDFTVELYTPKMAATVGPFLLGMQRSTAYTHESEALQSLVPREDLTKIRSLVDDIVTEVMAAPRSRGSIDVVSEVAEAIPVQLSARYFGLTDPDGVSLVPLGRKVFRNLFYNLRADPAIADPAAEAGGKIKAHLDTLIADRHAAGWSDDEPDDILARMLRLQASGAEGIDDTWIHTNLIGLLIGMLPLTSKVSSLAIDSMFQRPDLLVGAQEAVRLGDDDHLWAVLSEAMRFAPQTPGIFRVAARDVTIGSTSGRLYAIPAGTRVLAGTQPAMFDPRAVPEPSRVMVNRAADDYLTFGVGLHACFGTMISQKVQLPAIVKAVVSLPGVRRAPGRAGRLAWRGPFPDSLRLEFDLA